jgi:hypothetical protein
MQTLDIGAKNFIAGESLTDSISDRGFSPASSYLNLTKDKGVLYFMEGVTDIGGATLTGNIVAATYDKNYLGNDGYFVDDEGAFYTLSGTTFTKRQSTTSSAPVLGTTELIQFLGATYCSTGTQIMQLNGTDLTGAFDPGWWETGITANYRHPMERVEGTLYIGNVNLISTWDGTTSTLAGITLPTDANVTSLRKHPDGRTLLAFCGLSADYSHTRGLNGRIYLIDTVNKTWTREIDINTQVEGSRVSNGVVYVTYGQNIGYFNGNGISFLKRLTTSTTTYSHNIINFEDKLLIRDGLEVLCYGDLGAGNVWWKMFHQVTNAQSINCILYKGDNVLLVAFSNGSGAGLLKQVDYDNAGTNGYFYSNRYTFGSEVRIRRIDILHDVSNSAGTTNFTVYSRDIENTESTVQDVTYTNQSVSTTRINCDIRTNMFQLKITLLQDDIGFKLIRIFYEPI